MTLLICSSATFFRVRQPYVRTWYFMYMLYNMLLLMQLNVCVTREQSYFDWLRQAWGGAKMLHARYFLLLFKRLRKTCNFELFLCLQIFTR